MSLRVSQFGTEVLLAAAGGQVRVSQIGVEVLRAVAAYVPQDRAVSASASATFTTSASQSVRGTRVSQFAVEVLRLPFVAPPVNAACVGQFGVEVLVRRFPHYLVSASSSATFTTLGKARSGAAASSAKFTVAASCSLLRALPTVGVSVSQFAVEVLRLPFVAPPVNAACVGQFGVEVLVKRFPHYPGSASSSATFTTSATGEAAAGAAVSSAKFTVTASGSRLRVAPTVGVSVSQFAAEVLRSTIVTVPAGDARVAQFGVEVLVRRAPSYLGSASSSATFTDRARAGHGARVSQFATEVLLTSASGNARVSQFATEVLRTVSAYGVSVAVSASDSATFTAVAAKAGGHAVSASDSATFTTLAFGGLPRLHAVSASDSATFTALARTSESNTYDLSARDSATFAASALGSIAIVWPRHLYDSATFTDSASATSFPVRWPVAASDSARFTDVASESGLNVYRVSAKDLATFTTLITPAFQRIYRLSASASAAFRDTASQARLFVYPVSAKDLATFTTFAVPAFFRVSATASGTFTDRASFGTLHARQSIVLPSQARFTDVATATVLRARAVAAFGSAVFTTAAAERRRAPSLAAGSATFTTAAAAIHAMAVAASDSAAFTATAKSNQFLSPSAVSSARFTTLASVTVQRLGCVDLATFSDLASASVLLVSGLTVPGGDTAAGLLGVLYSPVSAAFPFSYVEAADGLLLLANGIDPMLAWDGLEGQAWAAGLAAPEGMIWADGTGVGLLVGQRNAYIRWVDRWGNTSNLNQASDPVMLGTDGLIVNISVTSGTVSITSPSHGLSTGMPVLIQNANGMAFVNGTWNVTTVDQDTFSLNGLAGFAGVYQGGGSWTSGASSVAYSNLPLPTNPNVVRRQILRNLNGNADVFYVDIDTTDLVSTTLSSSLTDEELATNVAVPIDFSDQMPSSNRFYLPPTHKTSLAAYAGRVFAATDLVYSAGNVAVTLGSPVVVGIGTAYTDSLAGRLLYVQGATQAQVIQSVMVEQQFLILELPYAGPTNPISFYAIRPQPVERRLVYYSEPDNPVAWPPWNAFVCPESSDEIVGIFAMRSFLFIVKQFHIYKFAYKEDPGKDGYMFQVAARGCVNNRCYAYVQNVMYLLDEAGIYAFDGDAAEPVGPPIQVLFKPDGVSAFQIDWTTDRTFWSCVYDPVWETIRWFVDIVGKPSLTYAICYDYSAKAWWLEQYAEAVTSSALAVLSGSRQSVVGTTARRVYSLGQGSLDCVQEDVTGTLRGTATASDGTSLTDSAASFPANLAGVPVTIVSGTGAGQQTIISSNTSQAIQVVQPWTGPLDATSVYQVGGISFVWKSGWYRLAEDESENVRDVELEFAPTATPATTSIALYYNYNTEPEVYGYGRDNDGVCSQAGSAYAIVDMTTQRGFVIQRLSGHRDPYGYGHRRVAVELGGVQGLDALRIFTVTINGASSSTF